MLLFIFLKNRTATLRSGNQVVWDLRRFNGVSAVLVGKSKK